MRLQINQYGTYLSGRNTISDIFAVYIGITGEMLLTFTNNSILTIVVELFSNKTEYYNITNINLTRKTV